MLDVFIVVGIIAALVVVGLVLTRRSEPTMAGRQRDVLFSPEDRRCVCCGRTTIYSAPMCPECCEHLRRSREGGETG
ncbi:MAG: hypothetical protein JW820_18640 [Spirochaetales bacterium]|nr:hypothetical protein [Spirochaetales bacterium]